MLILFPELIFAPYLTNVMFGPQIEVLIGKTQPNHVIQMKKSLCWVNVLWSLLGQEVPTFYFLYTYLEEINPKVNFLQFLMHGFSNLLRRDVNTSFIPPYVAILSLGIAIVTLALLIHVDSFLESSHPFLAPIVRHQVSVTPQGLEEMEHKPESHQNQGFTCEGNIMSEISKESLADSGHAKDTKI